MCKLFISDICRMKKNKFFWIGMIFMLVMGIIIPIMHYINYIQDGYRVTIDNGFFTCAIFIGIISSIFSSLFIGTEYSDGTIRNKIIIGQTRYSIYLSHLITCVIAGLVMCSLFFLAYLCVGIPLLGWFATEVQVILLFVGCIFAMTIACSSIYTLVAMLNQNKAVSSTICLLVAFVLLFTGTFIMARLSEPEWFEGYSYLSDTGEIITEKAQPNPSYLRGIKREIYSFLNDFLPGGQALQLSSQAAEKPWLLSIYSAIILVGTTGVGLLIFRKKDLK